jgi:hypothetical protein
MIQISDETGVCWRAECRLLHCRGRDTWIELIHERGLQRSERPPEDVIRRPVSLQPGSI